MSSSRVFPFPLSRFIVEEVTGQDMVSKEQIQDTRAALILALVAGIAVWAYLEGHLTPSLATDLVEIAADASGDLSN
jgi:hypothetical protein